MQNTAFDLEIVFGKLYSRLESSDATVLSTGSDLPGIMSSNLVVTLEQECET